MTEKKITTKRYVVDSLDQAIAEVKRDFGIEGMIFHQRLIREGGFFGFLGKERLEVIAGLPAQFEKLVVRKEEQKPSHSLSHSQRPQRPEGKDFLKELAKSAQLRKESSLSPLQASASYTDVEREELVSELMGSLRQLRKMDSPPSVSTQNWKISPGQVQSSLVSPLENVNQVSIPPSLSSVVPVQGDKELIRDVSQIKGQILEMNGAMKEMQKIVSVLPSLAARVNREENVRKDKNLWEGEYANLEKILMEKEFFPELVQSFLRVLKKELSDFNKEFSLEELKFELQERFKNNLKIQECLFKLEKENFNENGKKIPRLIVLVGPTGVGKTTTLAKLASLAKTSRKKSVAVITVDTFRYGAVEQVEKYCQNMLLECKIVRHPWQIHQAISDFSDKDFIFMDTRGASQKAEPHISSLKAFLPPEMKPEIHLVLSATSRYSDMIDTFRAFNHLKVDNLLFTKLDETSAFGPMLSILQKCTKSITYVTTGQVVPGDYREVDRAYLAGLMFKDSIF